MISFLNILRLLLCLSFWSILKNVPYALQKNVYSGVLGWKVLLILIIFIWSDVLFKADISLLIFCMDNLSIDDGRVFRSPTIIVFLSVSPFSSVCIHFIYFGVLSLGTYILIGVMSFWCIVHFIIIKFLSLSLVTFFFLNLEIFCQI